MTTGDEPIEIIVDECISCEVCVEMCPANPGVFVMGEVSAVVVNPDACEYCMLCVENCPTNAIKIKRLDELEDELT